MERRSQRWSTESDFSPRRDAAEALRTSLPGRQLKQAQVEEVYLQKEAWQGVEIGQRIELTRPTLDSEFFHSKGIMASLGNMVFDLVLMLAALGLVGVAVFRME